MEILEAIKEGLSSLEKYNRFLFILEKEKILSLSSKADVEKVIKAVKDKQEKLSESLPTRKKYLKNVWKRGRRLTPRNDPNPHYERVQKDVTKYKYEDEKGNPVENDVGDKKYKANNEMEEDLILLGETVDIVNRWEVEKRFDKKEKRINKSSTKRKKPKLVRKEIKSVVADSKLKGEYSLKEEDTQLYERMVDLNRKIDSWINKNYKSKAIKTEIKKEVLEIYVDFQSKYPIKTNFLKTIYPSINYDWILTQFLKALEKS